jgi:membrane protein YdbS with pleckstrin-like domain
MGADKLTSFFNRVFFLAAFLLLAIAVLERLVSFVGYTILGSAYTAGRMLEFAAIMLLFVIALLLRQVRESFQRKAP